MRFTRGGFGFDELPKEAIDKNIDTLRQIAEEGMEVKIKIEIDIEGRKYELDYEEGQKIYNQLWKVYGNKNTISATAYPWTHTTGLVNEVESK